MKIYLGVIGIVTCSILIMGCPKQLAKVDNVNLHVSSGSVHVDVPVDVPVEVTGVKVSSVTVKDNKAGINDNKINIDKPQIIVTEDAITALFKNMTWELWLLGSGFLWVLFITYLAYLYFIKRRK